MSQEDVERIRAAFAAFNRCDFDVVFQLWDEDTEYEVPEDMPERSSFRGPEGAKQFWASMLDVFEEFRSEPERIVEAGQDKYLVFVTERFRRKGDATAVEEHDDVLVTMRDGRIRRLQVFLDRRDALKAAGLSEESARSDISS